MLCKIRIGYKSYWVYFKRCGIKCKYMVYLNIEVVFYEM